MSSKDPKLPKYLRWLTPLVVVSLGLHGLGLLLPVPEKPEEIERPEFIEPESIQVSTLPPTLEPTPEPAPPPPPPPPPLPEPEPPPSVIAPLQEVVLFPEEDFPEEDFPEDDFPEDDTPVDDDEAPAFDDSDTDDSDDDTSDDDGPPAQNAYSDQGTSEQDYQLAAFAFSSKYPGVAVATNIPLTLTYTADKECFDPLPGEVQLGAALNNSGGVVEMVLFRRSGYQKIDAWIEDLVGFGELPPEAFAGLSVDSGFLPDWINETRSNGADPLVPPGEEAKAYAIKVVITVEGNRCE